MDGTTRFTHLTRARISVTRFQAVVAVEVPISGALQRVVHNDFAGAPPQRRNVDGRSPAGCNDAVTAGENGDHG